MDDLVTVTCSVCEAVMPVGVKVCDECGSPLAASAVPTVVSVLGERQRILMGPPRTGRSVAGVLSVPEGLRPRGKRFWWLAGGVFGAIAVAGCIIGATWLMSSGPEPTSVPSASPVAPSVVTLPGFDTAPTWSADRVVSASAAGTRVAGVVDGTATLWVARTGEVLAVSPITGEGAETVAGSVAGVPALAVATDTQALVWVGESVDPLVIALDGARRVTVRSGVLFIAGPGFEFSLVTAHGEVPLASPRPETVVLGTAGEGQVLWAAAPYEVITASANGTVLRSVSLTPPADGATVTPKRGWIRAASARTTVIGWTLPDGTTTTGVHSAETGELIVSIPGNGDGVLSPDGTLWAVDGYLVTLDGPGASALPDGFLGSRFLGGALYGALEDGKTALLTIGEEAAETVPASSVQPIAVIDGSLLTLTSGRLAVFPADE